MCPSYQLEHLLDICPGEDPPVVLCPIFWGTARLISRVVVQTCNPTNNGGVLVFLFLHILASICCHLNFWSDILTGVRWKLGVVLICISLMIKDVEYFFRCFSAIRYSSVENSFFSSVPHFYGVIWISGVHLLEHLYILDIRPLSDLELVKILFQSLGGLSVLLTVSFALQKLCNFMRSYLSILDLTAQAIAVLFRKFSSVPVSLRIYPTFST